MVNIASVFKFSDYLLTAISVASSISIGTNRSEMRVPDRDCSPNPVSSLFKHVKKNIVMK